LSKYENEVAPLAVILFQSGRAIRLQKEFTMKTNLLLVLLLGLSVSAFAQSAKAIRSDGTACAALPCVVASVSLTDRSTAASKVPIYTPSSDGVFRINIYMNTSNGSVPGAYWEMSTGWTDSLATRSAIAVDVFPNGVAGAALVQQDIAGQPLTYTVKPHGGGGGVGGMTYNLLVIVEQLQ
jgi:hypothetical protein